MLPSLPAKDKSATCETLFFLRKFFMQESMTYRPVVTKPQPQDCPFGWKWVESTKKPCEPGRCVRCVEIPKKCPLLYCYTEALLPVQRDPCQCPRCEDAPQGPCESVCDPMPCGADESYVWLEADRCICPVCRLITYE